MIRFSIITLGCKANQYDSAALGQFLIDRGCQPVGADQPADLLVVNTCCVTAQAMRKSRQMLRRQVARCPGSALLVAGCYSDYDAARILQVLRSLKMAPEKTAVAGHHGDYAACAQRLLDSLSGQDCQTTTVLVGGAGPATGADGDDIWMRADASVTSRAAETGLSTPSAIKALRLLAVKNKAPGPASLGPISHFAEHQRAFVKVQDGCDAFCSYCVVPYTRSVVRSRPAAEILDECRRLLAAGHREIVLSGVFLGAYGRPTALRRQWPAGPSPLTDLVRRVADLPGLWRLRLSSLEPLDLDDHLLAAYAQFPVLAPHFHLPLQSGSAHVLWRMNRQYTPDQFRHTVERLRETLDRPALTTDIIVGFPGEGEAEFEETLALARYAGFAKIHAFPFSAIEGTAAWLMRQDAPPPPVVRHRMARLADLEAGLAGAYRRQFVGQAVEALVAEPPPADGPEGQARWGGLTDRYLTVRFAAAASSGLLGQVVRLRVTGLCDDGITGELE